MNSSTETPTQSVIAAALLCFLSFPLHAGDSIERELDAAIKTGDFAGYLTKATTWLDEETPPEPTKAALEALLKDSASLTVLDQRHLIAKTGADKLGTLAKANPANQAFLRWLLKNTTAMDLYLEACVPLRLAARQENSYRLDTAALLIWRKIIEADPDAKDGLYLKLAIATGIAPPGSVNIGAGGAATPADPVVRYKYYKAAHQNKELFPSFDHLTAWEYARTVSSGASDADLSWAREMINTFRPDLRVGERVVKSTSLVWRRAAPAQFYPNGYVNFRNVLAGGGKCGPRASWAQMVCHAFGIPAVGVRQPRHACVAYKSGSAWRVDYGAGWQASKALGLKGPDFLAAVAERSNIVRFSQVEHLRWLAAALSSADHADEVMAIADAIRQLPPDEKTAAAPKPEPATPKPEPESAAGSRDPIKAMDGVLHVDAASFAKTGGKISWGGQVPHVLVHDCFTGGKQVYFQQQMKEQWADYVLSVPAAGTYHITMKAACINVDQLLEIFSGGTRLAVVDIPLSYGLWQQTGPVELRLGKGIQTLRVQTPKSVNFENHKRGIALHSFELKPK